MKHALIFLSLLTLSACGGGTSVETTTEVQEIQYGMPQGEIRYEGHGRETWFAYGAIAGIDLPASGVAQAHRFEDGRYLHTVQINIQPAADGYFYEGWLSNGKDMVPTGHLSSLQGDARHSLRFESDDDYASYESVIITLERDDGNPAAGTQVAQGLLRVTRRK